MSLFEPKKVRIPILHDFRSHDVQQETLDRRAKAMSSKH